MFSLSKFEDSAGNPVRRTLASFPQSKCTICHDNGHIDSKTAAVQNPPVFLLLCQLTQFNPYNRHEVVLLVAVVVHCR